MVIKWPRKAWSRVIIQTQRTSSLSDGSGGLSGEDYLVTDLGLICYGGYALLILLSNTVAALILLEWGSFCLIIFTWAVQ